MEQTANQFVSFFLPLFGMLFASVIVWFVLVSKLYKTLESEHPQKYEEMGRPTLFWNNSPRSGWVLVKFIMKKEYFGLKNQKLVKLGNFMFGFFIAYGILFGVLFVSVLIMIAQAKSHVAP